MRFKTIYSLQEGDIVASSIYDMQGRTVIAEGVPLTKKKIDRLNLLGFPGAYVNDEVSKDISIRHIIPPSLRTDAANSVREGDIDKAIKLAEEIVDEILKDGFTALNMRDLRSYDDYTYLHSVNVAIYSCVLGIAMKLSHEDLDYLVLAGLLHDLGKYKIPKEILNKPSRLTKEEYNIMKTHSTKSYEILSERVDIPVQVKNAVLLHHENEDGSGYPQGLTGDELQPLVKIIHVADVYDALISDRPYKKGYSPYEAAEYLMGACGIMFDQKVVETFLNTVPLYPKGTEVLLSTGQRAVVLDNKGINNLRPIVRTMDTFKTMDLSQREYHQITIAPNAYNETHYFSNSEAERNKIVRASAKRKLLVVDDMKSNIAMLRGIFEDTYDLDICLSGQEAIDAVVTAKKPYDLILMDIDMPKMTGVEATRRINDITKGKTPVLFVSAVRDREVVLTCRELNAAGYVARPYQSVYIKAEVERILFQNEEE